MVKRAFGNFLIVEHIAIQVWLRHILQGIFEVCLFQGIAFLVKLNHWLASSFPGETCILCACIQYYVSIAFPLHSVNKEIREKPALFPSE